MMLGEWGTLWAFSVGSKTAKGMEPLGRWGWRSGEGCLGSK